MKKPLNEATFKHLLRKIIREEMIDIAQDVDLPKPLENGQNKLPAGQYEMELSPDKRQYIWTDPTTKERVGIPVDLIQQMESGEAAPEEAPAEQTEQGIPPTEEMPQA